MAKAPARNGFTTRTRLVLAILAMIAYISITAASLLLWGSIESPIIADHFPAVVGLPMAAMAAFVIVILLPIRYGPIEFLVSGQWTHLRWRSVGPS